MTKTISGPAVGRIESNIFGESQGGGGVTSIEMTGNTPLTGDVVLPIQQTYASNEIAFTDNDGVITSIEASKVAFTTPTTVTPSTPPLLQVKLGTDLSCSGDGTDSERFGKLATVVGNEGVAIGAQASITNDGATAIGKSATVSGNGSIAIGSGATATTDNTCVIGSVAKPITRFILGAGNPSATPSDIVIESSGSTASGTLSGNLTIQTGEGIVGDSGGALILGAKLTTGTTPVPFLTVQPSIGTTLFNRATSETKRTTSAAITLTSSATNIFCTTSAAYTVTLPAASSFAGMRVTISDVSGGALTNNLTIARSGSDTIRGATSYVINTAYGACTLVSDGVNKWVMVSRSV